MGWKRRILQDKRLPWLALVGVAFIALSIFQAHVARYPYYAIDDMDQLTALDVLLIRGGVLPDHITHPTAGMYVLLSLTHRIGTFLGLLHLRDLYGIDTWANPLLGTAELIDFLRAHLPFLAVGGSILFAIAVAGAANAGPWMVVLVFMCVAASRALAFHTLVFRTDSFALFYAAASAAFAVASVKQRGWTAAALGVISGVSAGLAFTAKLQIVPTVALTPVLVLFMMVRRDEAFADAFNVSKAFNARVFIATLAVFVFLLLLALLPMPSTFIHTRSSFRNFGLCAAALVAVASPGIFARYLPERSTLYRFFSYANLMALGFLLSFLVLWFVMASPETGIRFVAALAKVCFLGELSPRLVPSYGSFSVQIASSPVLLLMPIVLLAVLAGWRIVAFGEFASIVVMGVLILASILWFDRMIINQDAIFTEPMVLALCGLMLGLIWARGGRAAKAIAAVCLAGMLVRGAAQAESSAWIDVQYPNFFHDSRQIMTFYQTGNQQKIQDAFGRLLVKDDKGHVVPAHSRDLIYAQAANYRETAARVEYAVPNLGPIDWSRIGVLGVDLKPFGQDRGSEWFTSVPPELEGATVYVPPDRSERKGAAWLVGLLRYCGLYDWETDAWLRQRTYIIRPRTDMNVFVFVPEDRKAAFATSDAAPVVSISDIRYVGVVVPINAPADLLIRLGRERDRFIVISRRYG